MDFIISRLPKRHKVERSTVGDAVQLELCVQCSSLDFKRFFDNERVRLEDFDHSIPDYRERVSMELVKRGHRKCSLCNDFFKIFNHFAKDSSGKPQSNLELFIAHSDKSHKIQRMFLSDARKDEWLLIPLRQSTRSTLLKGIDDLHGRRNRVRGPRIDYDLVKAWMEDCRANHGECTARNKWKRPPTSFRAIDCRTRQLRSLTVTDRYAALSYVWAQIPEQSQQSGERIGGLFPRLIEDAIAVTLNLGILFLWVDRYCITQSDEFERHLLIRNMDKIYAGADLTIIAAADTKAPYGLPGVSTDRRQPDIFAVGQSNFFSIRDPTHELQSSVWATRGWTYQEMVLSRRRLAFTDTQVYFQCKSMYRFELPDATWSPSPKLRSDGWLGSRYNAFPMDGPGQTASINLIYERIQGYYGRQLSYDSDILNAFSGVFSAYTAGTLESANDSNNGGVMTHFFGIPVVSVRDSSTGITRASLSAGLAWTVAWDKHSPKRPEKPSERTRVPHQASGWPSWSWTSFKRGRLAFSPNAPITPDTGNLLPVVLTHRNGTTVDLAQFASSKADYADFEPWIDVTSWVSKISEPQPDERALRRHLDPLLENRVPKTLTAMFLRLHEFAETAMEYGGYTMTVLLLEEVEDGVFRRVGIVEGSRSYPSAACSRLFASDVIIAPNPILHFPRGPGENPLDGWGEPMVVEKLEKKKIRLI